MTEVEYLRRARKEYWTRLIQETDGNISEAARRAGRSRGDTYAILRSLGLHKPKLWGNDEWRALGGITLNHYAR